MNKGDVDAEDSTCYWFLKSPKTEEYDFHKVTTNGWIVWTGTLEVEMNLSIICVECVGGYDKMIGVVKYTYHGS